MELFETMAIFRPEVPNYLDPKFVEACNRFNSILFSKIGATRAAETLYQWGLRGNETTQQLNELAQDYIDHIKD